MFRIIASLNVTIRLIRMTLFLIVIHCFHDEDALFRVVPLRVRVGSFDFATSSLAMRWRLPLFHPLFILIYGLLLLRSVDKLLLGVIHP